MIGRNLSDFTNDNGKAPTRQDSLTDDTAAMRKALAAGPGVVRVGPGFYRWSKVLIPSGVTVVGAGTATVVRPSGPGYIFEQDSVTGWAIKDIVFDGEAQGDWRARRDTGDGGVSVRGCGMYEIAGATLCNFNGAGLRISYFDRSFMGGGGGNLARIISYGNYAGICFDTRAEYMSAVSLACFNNVIGCAIHSGNVKISASDFGANVDGVIVEDKENGSHGTITGCMMNHNERYALLCRGVQWGMVFSGCCFFYGELLLENCKGVNITDGLIACTVVTSGVDANRISGNFIVPDEPWSFEFTSSTIVDHNFTSDGPWDKNRCASPDPTRQEVAEKQ